MPLRVLFPPLDSSKNVCATSVGSKVLLTISKVAAGGLFSCMTWCMLSKFYATRYFLHNSWLALIVNFEPAHDLHTCEYICFKVKVAPYIEAANGPHRQFCEFATCLWDVHPSLDSYFTYRQQSLSSLSRLIMRPCTISAWCHNFQLHHCTSIPECMGLFETFPNLIPLETSWATPPAWVPQKREGIVW